MHDEHENHAAGSRHLGRRYNRKEDQRLLTGEGRFTDDLQLPGAAHVAFVRSQHAHARIVAVHKEAALALPGVIAVVAPGDIPALDASLPALIGAGTLNNRYVDHYNVPPHVLLPHRATYVGEQVAVVIATDPYIAADAVDLVEIEYEALPVIATLEDSRASDAGEVHEGYRNAVAHMRHSIGDFDAVVAAADIILDETLETQSLKSMAIECRAVASDWDAATRVLTVWSTCHLFYMIRDGLARILDIPFEQVRVLSKDTGGSFGLKGVLHPEDLILPILAQHFGRPLRWSETRIEHMVAANHSGREIHEVKIAARKDGVILGLDLQLFKDVGAYNHFEMVLLTNTVNHLTTHYKIPNYRFEGWAMATHTSPGSPHRGAGRIEATFTMDRVLDAVARACDIDPAEVRRRNLIQPLEMPYPNGLYYRDGIEIAHKDVDFPAMLEKALDMADYTGWRSRQAQLRAEGRHIGIGIGSYVEAGGIGPLEGATITIEESGRIIVNMGVNTAGQSHETTMAQVCADIIGSRFEDVTVMNGDTALQPVGYGTGASRVGVVGGNAVALAARSVRKKVVELAAHFLECSIEDIRIRDGIVSIADGSNVTLRLGELAAKAWTHPLMKEFGGPGLRAQEFFYPRTVVWSSGVNVAVVEVDTGTGTLQFHKYVFVHDCGRPLNEKVVEGQILGGFVMGLGVALGEETLHDSTGQVLTGSIQDYYVPRAMDVPKVDMYHFVFPSSENPLGVKSVGESGPIAPPAAVAAAVEDAIGNGFKISSLPVTAGQILAAGRTIEEAGHATHQS